MITCYQCGDEHPENKYLEGSDTCVYCEREQQKERTKLNAKRQSKKANRERSDSKLSEAGRLRPRPNRGFDDTEE